MTCQGCKFYEVAPSGLLLNAQKAGICHRLPPQGFPVAGKHGGQMAVQFVFVQPQVKPDGWCGEYQAKESVP